MKSLVQAMWLLTTALGDTIILLIALIAFPNLAYEFVFYAIAMVVFIGILALLSIFYYEYNYYTGEHNGSESRSSDDYEEYRDGEPWGKEGREGNERKRGLWKRKRREERERKRRVGKGRGKKSRGKGRKGKEREIVGKGRVRICFILLF